MLARQKSAVGQYGVALYAYARSAYSADSGLNQVGFACIAIKKAPAITHRGLVQINIILGDMMYGKIVNQGALPT